MYALIHLARSCPRVVVNQPGTEQLNSFNDYFRKWYHDQHSHQSSPMPALRHLTVESLTEPFNEVIKRQQEVLRFFVALNGEELRGRNPDALNTINTLYDFTRPSIQTTRKRNRCMSCKKEPEKIDPPVFETISVFRVAFSPEVAEEYDTLQELVDRHFLHMDYAQCPTCGANIHVSKPGQSTSIELVDAAEAVVIVLNRALPNPNWKRADLTQAEKDRYHSIKDDRRITISGLLKLPTNRVGPNGTPVKELYDLRSTIEHLSDQTKRADRGHYGWISFAHALVA